MRNYRQGVSNPLPGFYRARVEDNLDPANIGRVKVRIPNCHGVPTGEVNDTSIKSKDLPWAYPCMPFGGGYDHGSFVVPEVGDIVWICFEAGNPNLPVYFGGVYGIASSEVSHYGNFLDEFKGDTFKASEGNWDSEVNKVTVPHDTTKPSTKVIYKSPKGTTIVVNEGDEEESISVIDRLGQYMTFECPVSESDNANNKSARRCKTVDNYNASDLVKEVARIKIKGASKQEIVLESTKNSSVLKLSSKDAQFSLRTLDNGSSISEISVGGTTLVVDSEGVRVNGEKLEDLIARIALLRE